MRRKRNTREPYQDDGAVGQEYMDMDTRNQKNVGHGKHYQTNLAEGELL